MCPNDHLTARQLQHDRRCELLLPAVRTALDVWGVARQRGEVDFEQRAFWTEQHQEGRGLVSCVADPVRLFLETNLAGRHIVDALHLRLEDDGLLVLSGPTRHCCGERVGSMKRVSKFIDEAVCPRTVRAVYGIHFTSTTLMEWV